MKSTKRKKLKKIPKFSSEAKERKFWQNVDSTEYVDYSDVEHWDFPNLKLTSWHVTIKFRDSGEKNEWTYETSTLRLVV